MAKAVNAFDKVIIPPEDLPEPEKKIGLDHGPDKGTITVDGVEHTIVVPECGCFTRKYVEYTHAIDHYTRVPDKRLNWSDREQWFRQTKGVSCGTCNNLEFKDGVGYCSVDHDDTAKNTLD